jgi:hypothetical protein
MKRDCFETNENLVYGRTRRRSINAFRKSFLAVAVGAIVCLAGPPPAEAQPPPPRPLYASISPERHPASNAASDDLLLNDETRAAPAKSVDDSITKFSARVAEAIRWTTNHSGADGVPKPTEASFKDPLNFWRSIQDDGNNNEQNLGFTILAKMAYKDYFNDDAKGDAYRDQVRTKLHDEHPGIIGTSPNKDVGPVHLHWHGEYDVLLQSYIALYYKYYDVLLPETQNKLLNELLTVKGPFPHWPESYFFATFSVPIVPPFLFFDVDVPETENHILMIEAARYLTNQLLFQQEVANAAAAGREPDHDQYDNNRNSGGKDGKPPLVVFILQMLQNILKSDFVEYNARPYQDYSMVAVLNLATYAYDDRVRLAARMVLDYVSAKVAVSSNNLECWRPYRRLNEEKYFGPVTSAVRERGGARSYLDSSIASVDPQTGFYTMLAGNTAAWGSGPPGSVAYEMVHAGLRDYRVPPSILDLFVTPRHRRFYQRFHHLAPTALGNTGQFADELYAGSPNYLISAGGHPTYFSGVTHLNIGPDQGNDPDRGVALPTTFLPTSRSPAFVLGSLIQLGQFGTEITVTSNLGVAPDFACGDLTSLPGIHLDGEGPWFFVDRGADGYFLAIHGFNGSNGVNPTDPAFLDGGFLEAFDTSLHRGFKLEDFKAGVLARNGSTRFQFPGENTYVTKDGQRIRFRIAPGVGDIVSTSEVSESPEVWKTKFASGTILDSDQGSGIIDITNPALPDFARHIRLDISNANFLAPRRTSESGEVEVSGVPNEVWVDFKYSGDAATQNGDFGDPFKTLRAARDHVAVGGTINIVPGSTSESLVLSTKMTIKSFPGSAIIGRQ